MNDCDKKGCPYNTDGQCLDKQLLMDPTKQTGCIFFKNKNIRMDE